MRRLAALLPMLMALSIMLSGTAFAANTTWTVDAYEDGSGVVYRKGKQVQILGEGVLPWDCTSNGNNICGATAPASVRGYKCADFYIPKYRTTLRYCTDGVVYAKRAWWWRG